MDQTKKEILYLLLDNKDTVLARGYLESPLDSINMQVRLPEGSAVSLAGHEEICMIAISEKAPNLLGRILLRRGNILFMEKVKSLGIEARQNLRAPVEFESYIYPLTGSWKGRRQIRSKDLSCGGIAFFSDELLEDGEELELVIPVTAQPLVLKCKVLRQRADGRGNPLYAAKFVDLCDDEDRMLRGAVFNIQIENHIRACSAG